MTDEPGLDYPQGNIPSEGARLRQCVESRIKLANHITQMADRFETELRGAIRNAKREAWWEGHQAGYSNGQKDHRSEGEEWENCPYDDPAGN